MTGPAFESFAILGAGLMGGSLALALREAGAVGSLVLQDSSGAALETARARKAADIFEPDPAAAVAGADGVCLAMPVGAFGAAIEALAPHLASGAVLTDLGSVKSAMLRARHPALPESVALVPGHPIAGAAESGMTAARADLFRGASVVLTPEADAPREAVERIAALWGSVGTEVILMTAEAHDRALAWTSHLPQAAASALMAAIGEAAHRREGLYRLSGPGLKDTTRLAGSDPALWADILLENRAEIVAALAAFQTRLSGLAAALEHGDRKALERLVAEGRSAKRAYEKDRQAAFNGRPAGSPARGEPES